MSVIYTTGELAKRANVSVRTVQYYDQRGILQPSEVTEGGRRIYSEDDLKTLQIICFLRELDFSIDDIGKILVEENIQQILDMLLVTQIKQLKIEVETAQTKLDMAVNLLDNLKNQTDYELAYLTDFSVTMKNKDSWQKLQWKMYGILLLEVVIYALLIFGVGHLAFEWVQWCMMGVFIPVYTYTVIHFRKKFHYLCPNCHQIFDPSFKEFAWAGHMPRTRKLTCPHCQKKSYCLELAKEK
ncbi:MerR family transcriptional regulator [Streptococcus gallolyticus]|nr:MerR family transcriptional regulator [Streptococcus gallolyticus]MBY5040888.1 MerR family transcriptional regulator [Streptococcus gallolyticus]